MSKSSFVLFATLGWFLVFQISCNDAKFTSPSKGNTTKPTTAVESVQIENQSETVNKSTIEQETPLDFKTAFSTNGSNPGGLAGGHFDLDTSTQVYPFSAGTTNYHVHRYDDMYNVTGVDFFNMIDDQFDEINEAIKNSGQRFIIIVGNSELSPAGVLEINGKLVSVTKYSADLVKSLASNEDLPVFTLGTPKEPGDEKLTKFTINFAVDTLEKGGLVAGETKDVRANTPGPNGEYRTGALTIQALDRTAFNIDPKTGTASLDNGGLLWEATIFWHKQE